MLLRTLASRFFTAACRPPGTAGLVLRHCTFWSFAALVFLLRQKVPAVWHLGLSQH